MGSVIFWVKRDQLLLRVEHMERSFFLAWLSQFRSDFPKAKWDSTRNAWRLQLKDTQRAAVFSYHTLGEDSFIHKSDWYQSQQLPLL